MIGLNSTKVLGKNVALLMLSMMLTASAFAADKALFTCSQLLSGNLSGQSEHTITGGSVSLTSSSSAVGDMVEVNAYQLHDSAGVSLEMFSPFWAFWGAADGNPNSNKENEPGTLVNNQLTLQIIAGNLTEENEGRDWYRSKNALQLNKQTGELQLSFGLRTCKNDFAGNCSFMFGGFKDVASVKMKCTPASN